MNARIRNAILITLMLAPVISLALQAADPAVESLRQTGKAFAAVARVVSPSVVFIQVEGKAPTSTVGPFSSPFDDNWPFGDDFFKRFFGTPFPGVPSRPGPDKPQPQQQPRVMGQGSGFVISSKDGLFTEKTYILTNNHVVEGADKILVRFQDGTGFEAQVTGRDPQSDVAVIEIKEGGIPGLRFSDSSQLEVGEWVVAIGNPFGLNHTLTVGVVSAKGRTSVGINDYEDFIQTDAAINPGNSGGPLVNLEGEVVGMNTAIFSRSGGYMGIGFAIPSNLVKGIAEQLIEHGEVNRGYLGIVIQQLTPELADSFGIITFGGILIAEVSEGSPAQEAGLRQGDVIVEFEGETVRDVGDFRNRVSLKPPGTSTSLTIIRNEERKEIDVIIGKLNEAKVATTEPVQTTIELGLTVQTITPDLAGQYNARPGEGVLVTEVSPGSIAALAGIRPGTVILKVNRKPIKNTDDFRRALQDSEAEKRALLLLRSGDVQRYVALSW